MRFICLSLLEIEMFILFFFLIIVASDKQNSIDRDGILICWPTWTRTIISLVFEEKFFSLLLFDVKWNLRSKKNYRFVLFCFFLFDACKSEKESRSKYSEEKENRRGE